MCRHCVFYVLEWLAVAHTFREAVFVSLCLAAPPGALPARGGCRARARRTGTTVFYILYTVYRDSGAMGRVFECDFSEAWQLRYMSLHVSRLLHGTSLLHIYVRNIRRTAIYFR